MRKLLYIGLDVHKESIVIAIAEPGRDGDIRAYGKINNSIHAMEKIIARLRKQYGPDVELHFCYEAGLCGFVLVRRLIQLGHHCIVVAPSKIPRQSGDKIKTDRRDADHRGSGEAGGDCRRQPRSGETSGSESKTGQVPPGRRPRGHLHPGSHRRGYPRSLPRPH